MSRKDKSIETESKSVVAGACTGKGGNADGSRVTFRDDDNVLKLDSGNGCTTL